MKTLVGKATLAAACVCLTPLFSAAQNNASQPGTFSRGIDRLTLLPGPTLLSPARTTPTMMPSPIKLGAANTVFVSMPNAVPGSGSGLAQKSKVTIPVPSTSVPSRNPPAESLRFDATLEPVSTPPKFHFTPAPKPSNRS